METKLARTITGILGGSFLVIGIAILLVVDLPDLLTGKSNPLNNPFMLKVYMLAGLYIFAAYLVASSPGKHIKRRFFSWAFSIIFHIGLLVYLGVSSGLGTYIMIFGMMEVLVAILSTWGLVLVANETGRATEA